MTEDVTGVKESSGLQIPDAMTDEGRTQTAVPEQKAQDGGSSTEGGSQKPGDDLKDRLEQLSSKYEQDISRLRQSLDRRYQQAETQWNTERDTLTKRLNELVMASMDEDEREAYELEILREERDKLNKQLESERQRSQQTQAMFQYAKYFNELGVAYDKLNMESPEALMESAWAGLRDTMTSMRKEMDILKEKIKSASAAGDNETQNASNQQVRKSAPQTFTGKGTPPSNEDILLQVQKGLKEKYGRDVSLEETFRHIESGQVDINSLLRAGG